MELGRGPTGEAGAVDGKVLHMVTTVGLCLRPGAPVSSSASDRLLAAACSH